MALMLTNLPLAFNAPAFSAPARAQVRFTSPPLMSDTDDWDSDVATTKAPTIDTTEMTGVVATATPKEFVEAGGFGPPRFTSSTWNPQNLEVRQ